jgi:hypothetical protein
MRGRSWITGGLVMILIVIAVILLRTLGPAWFLNARQGDSPAVPAQSGPLPHALAEEIKRYERASYVRGINDAVEFWRLTGVVPDTPAVRDALWARQQRSPTPITPSEARAILEQVNPKAGP